MRTLLFDVDGTLLMSDGGGRRAFELAIRAEFGLPNAETDIVFSGRTDRGLTAELLLRNRLPDDDHHRGRLRRRYASLLPAELVRSGGWVLPGAAELLGQLACDRRFQVAVMTGNFPETATRKLEHFGLRHYVRWIVGGDLDCQRDDLARRASAYIRTRCGAAAANDVMVIGDTPDDIRCGHAIGADAIAVCTGRYDRERLAAEHPLAILDDLSDVTRAMEVLSGDPSADQRTRLM